jgi:hypothetical protein
MEEHEIETGADRECLARNTATQSGHSHTAGKSCIGTIKPPF